MKKICESCKKTIEDTQIKNNFVFIIGDYIDGMFHAKKILFYHLTCLNGYKLYEKKKVFG